MTTQRARRIRAAMLDPKSWGPYCHGTSSLFAKAIKKKGLQPRQSTETGTTWKTSPSQPHLVYLGRAEIGGICYRAAELAADEHGYGKDRGHPVIYGVCLDKRHEKQLEFDEDAQTMFDWFKGTPTRPSPAQFSMIVDSVCTAPQRHKKRYRRIGDEERLPSVVKREIARSTRKTCLTDAEKKYIFSRLPRWVLSMLAIYTLTSTKSIPPKFLSGPFRLEEIRGRRKVIYVEYSAGGQTLKTTREVGGPRKDMEMLARCYIEGRKKK